MDLKDIQNLIKFVAKSGASEVKLEMEDIKITIKTGSDPETTTLQYAPVATQMPQAFAPLAESIPHTDTPPASAAAKADDNSKYITIKSPIIGTFYRKPAPDKPLFVEVGQTISEGDVLCIIEAMKVMNEVQADQGGEIIEILVEDSVSVEYGQPLFKIRIK